MYKTNCSHTDFIHESIEMEKTRCNIQLGNNRFVQASEFQEQLRIGVREWDIHYAKTKIPRKMKLASLSTNGRCWSRWTFIFFSYLFLSLFIYLLVDIPIIMRRKVLFEVSYKTNVKVQHTQSKASTYSSHKSFFGILLVFICFTIFVFIA